MTPSDLLHLWEQGERFHPLDRALLLLGHARPEVAWEDLAHLSVGQRDAGLMELRQRWFGPRLEGFARCPQCGEALEFGLHLPDLKKEVPNLEPPLYMKGVEHEFRLPNSRDLAAIAHLSDAVQAREVLLKRCVLGEPELERIAPEILEALEERMNELDPQAEVLLDLTCPACGQSWQALLDIAEFLWSEVRTLARRLLNEVHLLASSYGWSEAEILSLSSIRRQAYL